MTIERSAPAYAEPGHDVLRGTLERELVARLIDGLLDTAPGGAVLDLGCGDGLAGHLAGSRLTRYAGVDLRPPAPGAPGEHVLHDLREGLGPVGGEPFDLYLATFGVASHLAPPELERLLGEIARHARPGAVVALEALGLGSLEWPRAWDTEPGPARTMPYRLSFDVEVHPWAPAELALRFERAGIEPLRAVDRTVQAGPKAGEGRYWPGLPPLRRAMNDLLRDDGDAAAARAVLTAALPPLPAGPTASAHQRLAERRRQLVHGFDGSPAELARAIWELEPASGAGVGHGLTLVGRVP